MARKTNTKTDGSKSVFAEDLALSSDSGRLGFLAKRLARITSWYQARVDAGDLPGAVVAIARNGKLAYLQAIGFQDRDKKIPMKPDAIFWIASMTKPVTSVAAMMLIEEGKLDLAAPVYQYLPELKDMRVVDAKNIAYTGKLIVLSEVAHLYNCELALEPQKRPMTVLDLLRHTAGLVYPPQFNNTPVHRLYGEKILFERDRTLADLIACLPQLPLAHQPGEVWEYSLGVDVLARVVEVVSGLPFDQFLANRVFGPLRMVDTGFYVPEEKLGRLVDPPQEGRSSLWDVTKEPKLFSGGGGLVSTVADYLRFCQMLLNGGELDGIHILTLKTVQLMTTNSLPPDIRFVGDLIGPARGSTWGLGFAIRTDPESSTVPGSVGSFTWGGIWSTGFWIDPAEKLIAIQMVQVQPGFGDQFITALHNLTYGALKATEPSSFAPPATPHDGEH